MKADKAQIIKIDEKDFKVEVIESNRPIWVAFLAPWSRPCQVIRPVLDDVAEACAGAVRVFTVDADDNPGLGMTYEIHSIPTLLCFVEGNERARIVGTASKEAILAKMRPFIGAA